MNSNNRSAILLSVFTGLLVVPLTALLLGDAMAAEAAAETAGPVMHQDIWAFGLLAAAIATGLSSIGAGYAVASVGVAAVGTLAEKPELFGRVLILVGLAEGIAIYGLIISILVLNQLA